MFKDVIQFFTSNEGSLNVINVISAIVLALITAILSLVISILNNRRTKKTVYINMVTANRINWMNNLKELINNYVVMTQLSNYSIIYNEDRQQYFEKLLEKKNQIIFHINFQGYIDKKILEIINGLHIKTQVFYEIIELIEDEKDEKVDKFIEENITDKTEFIEENPEEKTDLINRILSDKEVIKSFTKVNFLITVNQIIRELKIIIERDHNELLRLVQVYCKLEWNRIKVESQGKTKREIQFLYALKAKKMIEKNKVIHIDNSYNKLGRYILEMKKQKDN